VTHPLSSIAPHRNGWADMSLARQFALAGGTVMFLATLAVGFLVSNAIEDAVTRNTGNATALYMESFIAPLTQDLAVQDRLSETSRAEIGALLAQTALGKRVVSFKIWRKGGLVVDSSNPAVIGKKFEVTDNLRAAWQGVVMADYSDTADEEDSAENAMGIPLLEIYSPVRDVNSGEVIAVVEFYEDAVQLSHDLLQARLVSWGAVAAMMALIWGSLFVVVLRGSRTIDRQLLALSDLSSRNVALRLRVQGAASRFSALNDESLRRIGADLHDGPAQLMGYVALRLDSLRAHLTGAAAAAEIASVEKAVKDSITEIRTIARGLSLPDIDRRALPDLIQSLTESHAARTGTEVALQVDPALAGDLPLSVKTCVYRAVQEALTNAWRHAEGAGQEVRLTLDGDLLRLSVLDRGPGLSHPPQSDEDGQDDGNSGMGLAGLTDRVESLGGHLELRRRKPGPGTELFVEIDLKGAA
jgi:signal transduction histidine kinase